MRNLLAAALVTTAVTTAALSSAMAAQSQQRDDAVVACLIGHAGVSLHKQIATREKAKVVNVETVTDVAMIYASKRCKGQLLHEGAGDYVYHSIKGMAGVWFE